MSDEVSRETKSLASDIDAQLAERAAGKRKNIKHGGTLCCRCHRNPPSTNGKYCKLCRNAYDAARRETKALGEKQKLSEGDTNEQHETIDIGQMPAIAGKSEV